jgi:hypothetical protein
MIINKFDNAKITKENLKKFFIENKYDITLRDIFNILKLTSEDLPLLELYLEKLDKEGFITKKFCHECGVYEYEGAD